MFAAQLVGLSVFGPDGELIGRIRDVVATLRPGREPFRVLGLVVELPTRRRIFVPMLRVNAFEPGAVTLSSGTVSLRRFRQRPNEVLLIGEVVGTRVRLVSEDREAAVVDAGMERTRTRDWLVTRLAVRERTGLLGRRGPVRVVEWNQVTGLGLPEIVGQPQNTRQLLALFDTMRAVDVAGAIHELPRERRYKVVDALDDERLADIIEELPEEDQKDLLNYLGEDRAADILEAMNPDDAADLLGELEARQANRLLDLMEPEESAPVRRLLAYSYDTAGGLMTPEPVVLTPDATIAEALARVRNPDLTPALASMVFVCRPPSATPTGRYLGCVHIQRLLREPPFELVAGALDTDLASLRPTANLAEITRYFAAYNLVCAPVVDDQEHLIGAVTVDDLLDHLLPEGWRETGLRDSETGVGRSEPDERAGRPPNGEPIEDRESTDA